MIVEGDSSRPDIPAGESLPTNALAIEITKDFYTVYEDGDEVPSHLRPKLLLLREDLDDDIVLWRYVDFQKLYSLFTRQALYFTPARFLRALEPYEMRLPLTRAISADEHYRKVAKEIYPGDQPQADAFVKDMLDRDDSSPLDSKGISCWHRNTHENNALWQVFVPHGGVAIRTTLGRLRDALDLRRSSIFADVVQYIDHQSDDFEPHPSALGFEVFFHKAKFFEYEREFRLVLDFHGSLAEFEIGKKLRDSADPAQLRAIEQWNMQRRRTFLNEQPYVPVDLTKLIQEIVIGPGASGFLRELVADLISRSNAPGIPVRDSVIGGFGL